MEAKDHTGDNPITTRTKPIVVTKFKHMGEQFGCGDYAEGFFTRHNGGFVFEVYFDSEPNEDTYGNTRMSEIYFKTEDGTPQWTWHAMNRDTPDWDYGLLLLADLLAGLDAAVRDRVANNMEYCVARVSCLVDQLLKTGVERPIVIAAMTEGLKRAHGENVA
jgi:hypothetical protein